MHSQTQLRCCMWHAPVGHHTFGVTRTWRVNICTCWCTSRGALTSLQLVVKSQALFLGNFLNERKCLLLLGCWLGHMRAEFRCVLKVPHSRLQQERQHRQCLYASCQGGSANHHVYAAGAQLNTQLPCASLPAMHAPFDQCALTTDIPHPSYTAVCQ